LRFAALPCRRLQCHVIGPTTMVDIKNEEESYHKAVICQERCYSMNDGLTIPPDFIRNNAGSSTFHYSTIPSNLAHFSHL
jgi:hypothetical protein